MKNKKFTLIELVSVIVVIAILASIVLINIASFKDKAVFSFVSSSRAAIQTAVDLYYLEHGKYPTLNGNKLTVTSPAYVDVQRLVEEGYVKKDVDLSKVSKQHYWLDVFGRVWGATEPTIEHSALLESNDGITQRYTVSIPKEYEKIVLYEVKNGENLTAAVLPLNNLHADTSINSKSVGKITYREINELETNGNIKLVIDIKDPRNTYLVGGVDRFGLETVPVGADYSSEGFQPIRGQVGEFEYKLEGPTIKRWLDFITSEDKPSDSKISYKFAIKSDPNGSYSEWSDDFYALEDAYGIRVKVKLEAATTGEKPSLYMLKVIYNTDEDKTVPEKPSVIPFDEPEKAPSLPESKDKDKVKSPNEPSEPADEDNAADLPEVCGFKEMTSSVAEGKTTVNYGYYLEKGNSIYDIQNANAIEDKHSLTLSAKKGNGNYELVESPIDVEEDSCVLITYEFDKKPTTAPNPIINKGPASSLNKDWNKAKVDPLDKKINKQPIDEDYIEQDPKEGEVTPSIPDDKEIDEGKPKDEEDDDWITISDFRVFQQGTQKSTTWYSYLPEEENIIENKTRIKYRFAKGDGYYWSEEVDDFPTNQSSNALLIHVYLQVHKDYINDATVADPVLKSIQVFSSEGYRDINLDKPSLLIYPLKDNNLTSSKISNTSKVTWHYEAEDPNGHEIVKVEWGTTLNEPVTYQKGTHSIRARVQNALGIWSDWVTYTFEVLEEKPVAQFTVSKTSIKAGDKISFNHSGSYDPDGDGIIDYEWKNKKDVYSESDTGKVTVSLRVKDGEGNWSDWFNKDIFVVSGNDIFYIDGIPSSMTGYIGAFDANRESYSTTPNDFTLTWDGDLTNKELSIYTSSLSRNGNIQVLDDRDKPIGFLFIAKSKYPSYSTFLLHEYEWSKEGRIIIPKNAAKIVFKNIDKVNNLSLIETPTIEGLESVTGTSTPYSVTLTSVTTATMNGMYAININNNTYSQGGNFLTVDALHPNTEYEFLVFGFNYSSNSLTQFEHVKVKTQPASVNFSGADIEVFDDNKSTSMSVKPTDVTTIRWDKDISGRSMQIHIDANSIAVTQIHFYDENDNMLYYVNDVSASGNAYSTSPKAPIKDFKFNAIVPEGAVKLTISNANKIYVVRLNENTNPALLPVPSITDITTSISGKNTLLNFKKTSVVNKVVIVKLNENTGSIATGTQFNLGALEEGVLHKFKLIAFNKDFMASEPVYFNIQK